MLSLDKVEALTQLIQPPHSYPRNLDGPHCRFFGYFAAPIHDNVTASDGLQLHSCFYRHSTAKTKRICVVFVHSHSSYLEEGFQLLEGCATTEYSLCTYDSRGAGRSGKGKNTFGEKEHIDLLYICLNLMVKHEIHEFIFWGRSIGSCAVVRLAAKLQGLANIRLTGQPMKKSSDLSAETIDLEKIYARFCELNRFEKKRQQLFRVLGLVLDSPLRSIHDMVRTFLTRVGLGFRPVTFLANVVIEQFVKSRAGADIKVDQNAALISKINLPCVFIVSKADEMVSLNDSLDLARNYGKEVGGGRMFHVCETNLRHAERRPGALVVDIFAKLTHDLSMNGPRFDHVFAQESRLSMAEERSLSAEMFMSGTSRISTGTGRLKQNSPLMVDLKNFSFSQRIAGAFVPESRGKEVRPSAPSEMSRNGRLTADTPANSSENIFYPTSDRVCTLTDLPDFRSRAQTTVQKTHTPMPQRTESQTHYPVFGRLQEMSPDRTSFDPFASIPIMPGSQSYVQLQPAQRINSVTEFSTHTAEFSRSKHTETLLSPRFEASFNQSPLQQMTPSPIRSVTQIAVSPQNSYQVSSPVFPQVLAPQQSNIVKQASPQVNIYVVSNSQQVPHTRTDPRIPYNNQNVQMTKPNVRAGSSHPIEPFSIRYQTPIAKNTSGREESRQPPGAVRVQQFRALPPTTHLRENIADKVFKFAPRPTPSFSQNQGTGSALNGVRKTVLRIN